jgi:drug/metabolite transporter (DMT)-like permease
VGSVFMQKGAMQETGEEAMKAGFLLKLVRKPVWLLGLAGDGLGYAAQAAALGVGKLIVVQPLLVSSVVFALPLGMKFTGQRVGKREVVGAIAVTVGLAAFTIISNPTAGKDDAPIRDWLVAGAVLGGIAAVLVVLARGRKPGLKAALLGTASGTIFGLTAGLTKSTVDRLDDGFVAVVADWHLWALIGVSAVAFWLTQASLQTGALAPALATTMAFETIAGVAVGMTILDEQLHDSGWGIAGAITTLVIALVGLVMLAGSQGAHEEALSQQGVPGELAAEGEPA